MKHAHPRRAVHRRQIAGSPEAQGKTEMEALIAYLQVLGTTSQVKES